MAEIRENSPGWNNAEPIKVTKKLVLDSLDTLNMKTMKRLAAANEAVDVRAATVATDDTTQWTRRIFCEDVRLSLPHSGEYFRALLLDRDKTEPLATDQMDDVISMCAGYIDADEIYERTCEKFKSGAKTRAHAWDLKVKGEKMRRHIGLRRAKW